MTYLYIYIPARLDDHRFRISYTEATQFIVVVSRIFFRHELLSFRLDQTAHQRRACMSAASKACQQLCQQLVKLLSFRLDQTAHQRRACMSAASKACQQLCQQLVKHVSRLGRDCAVSSVSIRTFVRVKQVHCER